MTERQALSAARRMFGKRAVVERLPKPSTNGRGDILMGTHRIGVNIGWAITIKGWGMNWAEAVDSMNERHEQGYS